MHRNILYLIIFLIFSIPNVLWYLNNHTVGAAIHFTDLIIVNICSTLPYFCISLLILSVAPGVISWTIVALSGYLLSLLSWLGFAHSSIYGHNINGGSIYVALNSNIAEMVEYLTMYCDTKVLASLFGIIAVQSLHFFFLYRHRDGFINNRRAGIVIGILLVPVTYAIVAGKVFAETQDNVIAAFSDAFWVYRIDEMKLSKMREKGAAQRVIISGRIAIKSNIPETYVLVLGESISRRHMSLYGYHRNTNPFLSGLSNEIFSFEDVVSAEMYTIASLQKILTFANHEDMSPLYEPHLLHIMKSAGFKVYWLSNQKAFGPGEPWSKYLSEASDERVFTNIQGGYDERLLAPLKRIINNDVPKKFIIMHLMGAHVNAKNRYPKEFNFFTHGSNADWIRNNKRSTKTYDYIDAYDNAIRYEDYVIFNIINTLKSGDGIRMMLYLPDHGEEVGEVDDFIGRCFRTTRYMFEIPLIAWMSPEYFVSRKDMYGQLKKAVHRPFQTDSFIHTFMDLTGIWTDRFIPERSIVNEDFKPRKRYLDGKDYETIISQKILKPDGAVPDFTAGSD